MPFQSRIREDLFYRETGQGASITSYQGSLKCALALPAVHSHRRLMRVVGATRRARTTAERGAWLGSSDRSVARLRRVTRPRKRAAEDPGARNAPRLERRG